MWAGTAPNVNILPASSVSGWSVSCPGLAVFTYIVLVLANLICGHPTNGLIDSATTSQLRTHQLQYISTIQHQHFHKTLTESPLMSLQYFPKFPKLKIYKLLEIIVYNFSVLIKLPRPATRDY